MSRDNNNKRKTVDDLVDEDDIETLKRIQVIPYLNDKYQKELLTQALIKGKLQAAEEIMQHCTDIMYTFHTVDICSCNVQKIISLANRYPERFRILWNTGAWSIHGLFQPYKERNTDRMVFQYAPVFMPLLEHPKQIVPVSLFEEIHIRKINQEIRLKIKQDIDECSNADVGLKVHQLRYLHTYNHRNARSDKTLIESIDHVLVYMGFSIKINEHGNKNMHIVVFRIGLYCFLGQFKHLHPILVGMMLDFWNRFPYFKDAFCKRLDRVWSGGLNDKERPELFHRVCEMHNQTIKPRCNLAFLICSAIQRKKKSMLKSFIQYDPQMLSAIEKFLK